MDSALKSKWVEALRSGKYKQCTSVLRDEAEDAYCCLGVLCVVAGKQLEEATYNWLNTVTRDYGPFVTLNDDDGASFLKIADYIEAHL